MSKIISELSIIIPAHNEEANIELCVNEIVKFCLEQKLDYQIIISEDGSTDNTLEVLLELKKKYPIKIISSKNKKSYSVAVLDGIKSATADYLLLMDSDGQSNPDEVVNFWKNRKNANLINGNRVNRDDYMYRKLYSKIAYLIYQSLFNVPLKDPSYAYVLTEKKVYSILSSFKPKMPDGFFWEFNARALKKGFTFFNLDVVHKKRIFGETRIYHWKNLPLVSVNNFIGMISIKFFS